MNLFDLDDTLASITDELEDDGFSIELVFTPGSFLVRVWCALPWAKSLTTIKTCRVLLSDFGDTDPASFLRSEIESLVKDLAASLDVVRTPTKPGEFSIVSEKGTFATAKTLDAIRRRWGEIPADDKPNYTVMRNDDEIDPMTGKKRAPAK